MVKLENFVKLYDDYWDLKIWNLQKKYNLKFDLEGKTERVKLYFYYFIKGTRVVCKFIKSIRDYFLSIKSIGME